MPPTPRKAVSDFATRMEEVLQNHDEAKGECGWLTDPACTVSYLLDRLQEEASEACEAYCDNDMEKLQSECVDVANFAMMITERIRAFLPSPVPAVAPTSDKRLEQLLEDALTGHNVSAEDALSLIARLKKAEV